MEEKTMKLYTLGELIDTLKEKQMAIKIEGVSVGSRLYSKSGKLVNQYDQEVSIAMPPRGKWIIINLA